MKLSDAIHGTIDTRWAGQRSAETSAARARACLAWLGDRPVRSLRASDVRRMAHGMRAAGLAAGTVNRHLSALSAVLEHAGKDLRPLPWQTEPRGRTRSLSKGEVANLQAAAIAAGAQDVACLLAFLAETGLRVGEALALRWEDLELGPNPRATVQRSKNGESRAVPLTADAARAVGARSTMAVGPWYATSQSRVNHVFRVARDTVVTTRGDDQVVPHALRHTCATRLAQAGVSAFVIQSWLGHRDYRSTLRYVHVDQAGLAAAARALESA